MVKDFDPVLQTTNDSIGFISTNNLVSLLDLLVFQDKL